MVCWLVHGMYTGVRFPYPFKLKNSTMINIYENFITEEEQTYLLKHLPFPDTNVKCVKSQQYSDVSPDLLCYKRIPYFLKFIVKRLAVNNYVSDINTIAVNHYLKGFGLDWHKDHESIGSIISVLSLMSECKLLVKKSSMIDTYFIPGCSLYQMVGNDRYCEHYVHPLEEDRISIVFFKRDYSA